MTGGVSRSQQANSQRNEAHPEKREAGTAGYGTVRPVVWEDGMGLQVRPSYPINRSKVQRQKGRCAAGMTKTDGESDQRYQLILIEAIDKTGLIKIFDNARIYK